MTTANLTARTPANGRNTALHQSPCWTATEVFMAIAPHRTNRLMDPAAALAPHTRRAHFVAVRGGLGWRADGRYPLDVWMQIAD